MRETQATTSRRGEVRRREKNENENGDLIYLVVCICERKSRKPFSNEFSTSVLWTVNYDCQRIVINSPNRHRIPHLKIEWKFLKHFFVLLSCCSFVKNRRAFLLHFHTHSHTFNRFSFVTFSFSSINIFFNLFNKFSALNTVFESFPFSSCFSFIFTDIFLLPEIFPRHFADFQIFPFFAFSLLRSCCEEENPFLQIFFHFFYLGWQGKR